MFKKSLIAILFFAFLIFDFSIDLFAEIKFNPVINLSLYGGKYYLDGESASFDGKLDAFISPSIILNDNNELYPLYMGYYNGTQDVQELAGGGVLTRQRQEHTISLKYVRINDFDKIKPRISYSKALVKETKDENWGDGLFDYNTMSVGIDFEQERPYGTFTESYDFSSVQYPNYASLISEAETVIDTTTYSELSKNAGSDILNNTNHRLAFSYTWFPEPLVMTSGFNFNYRKYDDQYIVSKDGSFKSDKRKDMSVGFDLKIQKPVKPVNLSFSAGVDYLNSNQNSYDASRTKYIDNYYDYIQADLSPSVNFYFKNNASFGYALSFRKIYYSGRLAQDASGNYKSSKINQEYWLNSLYFRYPVMNNFFAKFIYAYNVSSSNMKYEAGYRYNYRANNYLIGIDWEF